MALSVAPDAAYIIGVLLYSYYTVEEANRQDMAGSSVDKRDGCATGYLVLSSVLVNYKIIFM